MILVATNPDGNTLAFKVDSPATEEDRRRTIAIASYIPDAVWAVKPGEDVR